MGALTASPCPSRGPNDAPYLYFADDLPVSATKKSDVLMAYPHYFLYCEDGSACRKTMDFEVVDVKTQDVFHFSGWIERRALMELFGDAQQSRYFTCIDGNERSTIDADRPPSLRKRNIDGVMQIQRAVEAALERTAINPSLARIAS